MDSLFYQIEQKNTEAMRPLADRLRPTILSEVIGQEHLVGQNGAITRMINSKKPQSIILWGPPGCGKTTIAKLIAAETDNNFAIVSAVTSGVAELKKLFALADNNFKQGKRTVILVDEIHRFNRAQQDVFLPYIENGTIIMIGATTENPSFALNAALLSRCQTLTLKRLETKHLLKMIERAEKINGKELPLTQESKEMLASISDGDGRYLLGICETLLADESLNNILPEQLPDIIQRRMPVYDKAQDGHYNLLSAFHKSLRGSDVDAALYWSNRILGSGEDPLTLIRRMVAFASEDICMADPNALVQVIAAKEAYQFLGMPEGRLAITQAVVYLATAPKSNSAYSANKLASHDAKQYGSLMPPKHILNAPTKLMKQEGYGKNYVYDHDTEHGFAGQNFFPEEMGRQEYYQPVERGFERDIKKRLQYWKKIREQK